MSFSSSTCHSKRSEESRPFATSRGDRLKNKKLRIIPLGGLGEVGKNMMALEYADDIVVIDAGLMFPSEEMLGVDLLIPDISYLLQRKQNLRGIVITHGHEDHIGALPYVLSQLNLPIYATKLAGRLISAELKQRGVKSRAKINVVHGGSRIILGNFTVELFPVCHSIPDSMGLIIHTPVGIVVHSGDFKLDYTPVIGKPTDLSRLAWLGRKGVLLLLSDSTYVELSGYTPSERVVSDTLDHIMMEAAGRVIITTFSSLISRMQQVIDVAAKHGRRVFITGRSMEVIVKVAAEMGYLVIPPGVLCHFDEIKHLPHNRVVILTTGSQGEPTSALVRMANRGHSQVQIVPGDTVVMSATPVPGNEALVSKTIDSLFRQGANVIYEKLSQVHVHGHGSQEELKLLFNLVKPKFFVPIHGEYRHLSLHARLARSLGMPGDNIFVLEDGDILELGQESGKIVGKVPIGNVYVDGLVTGELDSTMLRDRKLLSRDGIVVVTLAIDAQKGKLVGRPCIITRGFVDAGESQTLIEKSQDVVIATLNHDGKHSFGPGRSSPAERSNLEAKVRDSLTKFLYEQTHRRPIIIPIIMEV
ncbi:MAG: ribonuclease J [Dehalococcoidia bacterium]|nr:ribonuclease J [Dehalococcoidia bacterium]